MTAARRIVFLDTETTGLDAAECAIVQYSLAVWCDGEVTFKHTRKVLPHEGAVITPEACRVNGYHPEDWRKAGAKGLSLDDVKLWHDTLSGSIVGGSNVAFDKGFIAESCKRLGSPPPKWNHRDADIGKIAFPLWAAGVVENTGLAALAQHFGVEHARPHDAESDVLATIGVFEALCNEMVFKPNVWRQTLEDIADCLVANEVSHACKALAETGVVRVRSE